MVEGAVRNNDPWLQRGLRWNSRIRSFFGSARPLDQDAKETRVPSEEAGKGRPGFATVFSFCLTYVGLPRGSRYAGDGRLQLHRTAALDFS